MLLHYEVGGGGDRLEMPEVECEELAEFDPPFEFVDGMSLLFSWKTVEICRLNVSALSHELETQNVTQKPTMASPYF